MIRHYSLYFLLAIGSLYYYLFDRSYYNFIVVAHDTDSCGNNFKYYNITSLPMNPSEGFVRYLDKTYWSIINKNGLSFVFKSTNGLSWDYVYNSTSDFTGLYKFENMLLLYEISCTQLYITNLKNGNILDSVLHLKYLSHRKEMIHSVVFEKKLCTLTKYSFLCGYPYADNILLPDTNGIEFNDIAYNKDQILISSTHREKEFNRMYTSRDLFRWNYSDLIIKDKVIPNTIGYIFKQITWWKGTFWALTTDGRIASSVDGLFWTWFSAIKNKYEIFYHLISDDDTLVATTLTGLIYVSQDGIKWDNVCRIKGSPQLLYSRYLLSNF